MTGVEEDRFSNLPEHLIDSILERVPLEDAVRTSILSNRWRYRWTTMKALVFDYQFFIRFAENGAFGGNELIKIINQVLTLYKGPISEFHLFIPKMNPDNFHEVDEWMLFLSRNSVKELTIYNTNQHYELPSHLFSCLELEKLQLVYFSPTFFKPPLEFKGFLNLEELVLHDIDFGVNLPGTTQISLPQLKKLSIHDCTNVNNFNFKAAKLQSLVFISRLDAMFSRLLDRPSLMELSIFYLNSVQVEKMNFTTMLSNLPNIEGIFIIAHFLKRFIAETIPKWLPHAVNSLKVLHLADFKVGDMNQLRGVFCLLRNSPNLKRLVLLMQELRVVDDEVEALNHLEAPNCLDCTLIELETVGINSLQGSRLELLLIKILLAHTPSLYEFIIKPNGIFDAQERVDIGNDIMQFPQASPRVELIFYLNPES